VDPILREMLQAREVQPHALAKWQTHIQRVIQPALDRLAALDAAATDEAMVSAAKRSRGVA